MSRLRSGNGLLFCTGDLIRLISIDDATMELATLTNRALPACFLSVRIEQIDSDSQSRFGRHAFIRTIDDGGGILILSPSTLPKGGISTLTLTKIGAEAAMSSEARHSGLQHFSYSIAAVFSHTFLLLYCAPVTSSGLISSHGTVLSWNDSRHNQECYRANNTIKW